MRHSTGIRDKKGKMIKEGNWCKFDQGFKTTTPGICKIVFYFGAFRGQLESGGYVPFADWTPIFDPRKHFEVVDGRKIKRRDKKRG